MNTDKEPFFWRALSIFVIGLIFVSVVTSFYYPWQKIAFPNADFEEGGLRNWIAEGDAFKNQPTFGDNVMARRGVGTANLEGNYWIGTFERRNKPTDPAGVFQNDPPVGRLISVAFKIERNHLSFLIGGGDGTNSCEVALEVGGKGVLFESGRGRLIWNEKMSRVTWDVSKWKGQEARTVITDNAAGPWGHINADDFRYA